jgi:hypothetical protein
MPTSSKCYIFLVFPHTNLPSPHYCQILCPPIATELIALIIIGDQYRSLCSLPHLSVTASLLGLDVFLRTLFSNTLSLYLSLNMTDQVSHPYKTTGKIIYLYILLFIFYRKLEEKDCTSKDKKKVRSAINS